MMLELHSVCQPTQSASMVWLTRQEAIALINVLLVRHPLIRRITNNALPVKLLHPTMKMSMTSKSVLLLAADPKLSNQIKLVWTFQLAEHTSRVIRNHAMSHVKQVNSLLLIVASLTQCV